MPSIRSTSTASAVSASEQADDSGIASPAIRTRGLTKYYGDVPALVDLDLDVGRGEVFGFLGPNGAGKTTMIRTILDEIRPTSGQAWIMGDDVRHRSEQVKRHIGYLPGGNPLYPDLTGRQTIRFLAELRGELDEPYVEQLAARLGADLDTEIGELSSGNRQKIGLIQAFMGRPDVLIMDEPSTGLDPLVQRELQAMMREVADDGRTVFLSSHTLSEVQRVADRVAIIRRGRLVAVERLSELRSKARRRVDIEFATPIDENVLRGVPGVDDIIVDGTRATFSASDSLSDLLHAVAGRHDIVDIATREPDLDEIFLTYYRETPSDLGPVP